MDRQYRILLNTLLMKYKGFVLGQDVRGKFGLPSGPGAGLPFRCLLAVLLRRLDGPAIIRRRGFCRLCGDIRVLGLRRLYGAGGIGGVRWDLGAAVGGLYRRAPEVPGIGEGILEGLIDYVTTGEENR